MSANDLKKLGHEINSAIHFAIEDEFEAQVKAFHAERPREFGLPGCKLAVVEHDKKLITKLIREDIKRAKQLPASNVDHLPAKLKVSVRHPRWNSIDINVTESPVAFTNPAFEAVYALDLAHHSNNPDRYTVEGQRILDVLERIAAQYNYDKSDYQTDYFDVNFYCHPGFTGEKTKIDPELLGDMKVMKLENERGFLARQLESINAGRAWELDCGVLRRWYFAGR